MTMSSLASQVDALHVCLEKTLRQYAPCCIALSGGVDSMTLALVAGRMAHPVQMFHAISPAVPSEATERVRTVAARENWSLTLLKAGEFSDEAYLANPYTRCFYCKSNLYQAIRAHDAGTILSGANQEDWADFRPGLKAAAHYQVRHPLTECGADKALIRRLCAQLGYPELAALPASPCLSSRIETGIRIQASTLDFVYQVERELRRVLQPKVARCRIRAASITLEVDDACYAALSPQDHLQWQHKVRQLARPLALPAEVIVQPYRMGSAFVAS